MTRRAAPEPYTPSIEEVRKAIAEWVWSRRMFRYDLSTSDGEEFDRFLANQEPGTRTCAATHHSSEPDPDHNGKSS